VSGVIDDDSAQEDVRKWAFMHYGTGSRAFYTLFEATLSGGWPAYARPLIEDVSPWFAIFWIVYVLLVVFAIMRVITAIFLQKTMKMAGADDDLMLVHRPSEEEHTVLQMKDLLAESDTDGCGEMNKNRLELVLQLPDAKNLLAGLGLDSQDVLTLFGVLDNGEGEVSHDAIARGIARICGTVRAIDTVMIMHEQHKIMKKLDHAISPVAACPLAPPNLSRGKRVDFDDVKVPMLPVSCASEESISADKYFRSR